MRKYLKDARTESKLTQLELAKRLGISQNYYCDIENGVRQKDLKNSIVMDLSKVLNVSVETILKEEEKFRKEQGE